LFLDGKIIIFTKILNTKTMKNPDETKKTEGNTLKDLKEFLAVKLKPEPVVIKPNMMSDKQMADFYKLKILPVFEKLKEQLTEFNFEKLDFDIHTQTATFKAFEILSDFSFKVSIDNSGRKVRIFYDLKYRHKKRKKSTRVINAKFKNISFSDIETINEKMLISLFTKWYMSKDDEIQKHKEYLKNQTLKNNNEENNSAENVND